QVPVRGHEDRRQVVVEIPRDLAAIRLFLREELTREALEVAVQLEPVDREGGLVGEDAKERDRLVAGVTGLAIDVQDAEGLRADEVREADREGHILRVRRLERGRGRALDDDRRLALERL